MNNCTLQTIQNIETALKTLQAQVNDVGFQCFNKNAKITVGPNSTTIQDGSISFSNGSTQIAPNSITVQSISAPDSSATITTGTLNSTTINNSGTTTTGTLTTGTLASTTINNSGTTTTGTLASTTINNSGTTTTGTLTTGTLASTTINNSGTTTTGTLSSAILTSPAIAVNSVITNTTLNLNKPSGNQSLFQNIVYSGASQWSSITNNVNGTVYDIIYADVQTQTQNTTIPTLFVGGQFNKVGNLSVNNIAAFNLNTNTWSALSTGVTGTNASVNALAYNNGTLYVGGLFTNGFSNQQANNVISITVQWNISGTQCNVSNVNNLSGGVTGQGAVVQALLYYLNNLYVGGTFTLAGGVSGFQNVAYWPTSSQNPTWNNPSGGVSGGVSGQTPVVKVLLYVNGSNSINNGLYAGGTFTTAGSAPVNNIAYYNAGWFSISGQNNNNTGVTNGSSASVVNALLYNNNRLYVGGTFSTATVVNTGNQSTSTSASNIAIFTGSGQQYSWSAIGSGLSGTSTGTGVYSLYYDTNSSQLYAGGLFNSITIYGTSYTANNIAVYNSYKNLWNIVGSGANNTVQTLTNYASTNDLYIGGSFTTAGGSTNNGYLSYVNLNANISYNNYNINTLVLPYYIYSFYYNVQLDQWYLLSTY